jgi:hypothetical protein
MRDSANSASRSDAVQPGEASRKWESLEDRLDTNQEYAAVVFLCMALAMCTQIAWNVPIHLTAPLWFPLIKWFFRPAFEQAVTKAKKPSDELSPFREL